MVSNVKKKPLADILLCGSWGDPCTPPKFNIDPEKWGLEDEFPFGIAYF